MERKEELLTELLSIASREEIIQALDELNEMKYAPTRKTLETVKVGDFAFADGKFSTNPYEYPNLLGIVGYSDHGHGLIVWVREQYGSWAHAIVDGFNFDGSVLGTLEEWNKIKQHRSQIDESLRRIGAPLLREEYVTDTASSKEMWYRYLFYF